MQCEKKKVLAYHFVKRAIVPGEVFALSASFKC